MKETGMYNIGIEDSLNRERIRKLLIFGLIGSVLTGAGDFLLGYAEETGGTTFAAGIMSSAPNLTDTQMIAGSMLGMVGILLEGLACFAVYRLMVDKAPKYAHIYRTFIFGYIWLAPVGSHMNMGLLNYAYKYMLLGNPAVAEKAAGAMFYGFALPVYTLLVLFWLPAMIIQFKAFNEEKTPYPRSARWFNVVLGSLPALILSGICGIHTALGAGIGTMFLSFGNGFMFGGLLVTLPSEETFEAFRRTRV